MKKNGLTHTASTAHNLTLFVFALITTPPDHILPSPSAFKTRALAILCSTLITSTTNLFTVTSKTAITKQRGTRECIAYNLSIVLRLDKNKTSKNFKKSTDYQLRNKWMKDTLDSELNSRAVGAVYRRWKMQDHKRAIQWLSFRNTAQTMHFSALK